MKTIQIKEAQAQYNVDPAQLQEPTIIEVGGKPVAVLVPYEQWERLQERQGKRSKRKRPEASEEFMREVEAFERMRPALLEQYPGRVVAIHGGQVVGVGDSPIPVYEDVVARLGRVTVCVEWVEPDSPRRARIPSVWVKR